MYLDNQAPPLPAGENAWYAPFNTQVAKPAKVNGKDCPATVAVSEPNGTALSSTASFKLLTFLIGGRPSWYQKHMPNVMGDGNHLS